MPPAWPVGMTCMQRSWSSLDRRVRARNFSTSAAFNCTFPPRVGRPAAVLTLALSIVNRPVGGLLLASAVTQQRGRSVDEMRVDGQVAVVTGAGRDSAAPTRLP